MLQCLTWIYNIYLTQKKRPVKHGNKKSQPYNDIKQKIKENLKQCFSIRSHILRKIGIIHGGEFGLTNFFKILSNVIMAVYMVLSYNAVFMVTPVSPNGVTHQKFENHCFIVRNEIWNCEIKIYIISFYRMELWKIVHFDVLWAWNAL